MCSIRTDRVEGVQIEQHVVTIGILVLRLQHRVFAHFEVVSRLFEEGIMSWLAFARANTFQLSWSRLVTLLVLLFGDGICFGVEAMDCAGVLEVSGVGLQFDELWLLKVARGLFLKIAQREG